MSCPDPSAHNKGSKMQHQASTAALLASSSSHGIAKEDVLDKDNNLSSKSAAASLKHARPETLPSFPVVGISTESSMSAAQLANKNTTQFQTWKPDASSSASRAAILANKNAKDFEHWKPEMSAAGSKAALLAHKDGARVASSAQSASSEGNSAASQAMRKKSVQADNTKQNVTNKALVAATGAVAKGRARAGSTPAAPSDSYPDASKSAQNALTAATTAHRPAKTPFQIESERLDSEANEAARIRHIGNNVSREMWTENPPVELEVKEKTHNDALRASAVVMAKQMYELAQKQSGRAKTSSAQSAAMASNRNSKANNAVVPDLKQQATQYLHLQEAAYKLAQERLAKIDPDGSARYREHYGFEQSPKSSRLSRRGRSRRRASEGGANSDDDADDSFTSRRIKSQMNQLNQKIQDTDAKKREQDRASVYAAAERKVQAQLQSMDERVFADTGKVSPAMQEQWEAKAREKAKADSAVRTQHVGKTYIGNGRYLDAAEIEAIAAARLKPTLDELTETAERRRAYDEAMKLQEEANDRARIHNKQNVEHDKIELKRAKHESKMLAKQEKLQHKAEAKEEKLIAKQIKAQQKEAEKNRHKAIDKEKYLEKRSRSRSQSRHAHKVYGTDAANASEAIGVHSTTSLVESRRASTVADHSDGAGDVPPVPKLPLGRTVSSMSQIGPDGKKQLRPEIDRQVTTVETSESEDAEHDASKTATRKTLPIDTTTPAPATQSSAPKTPGKQIKGFFHKLTHRRSRATSLDKEYKDSSPAVVNTTVTISSTPAPVVEKAPVIEQPVVAPIDTHASASPSSFTRHSALPKSARSDSSSSLSSDDEEATRGRQGRRHKRNPLDDQLEAHDHENDSSGIMSSTEAPVTGDDGAEGSALRAHPVRGTGAQRTLSSATNMTATDEEFEEAKDTFETDDAAAAAASGSVAKKGTSPARGTKFREEV